MSQRPPSTLSGPLGRLVGGLFALAVGLFAVFALTALAVVAAGLALVGLARLWWLQRRAGGGDDESVIEAEYTVRRTDERGPRDPDAILPPPRPRER